MNLQTALRDSGCVLDPTAFRDLVRAIFVEKYPALTDEDVYCRPAEAMIFCNRVRQAARAPQMADEMVLRTLTNIRKRGELPRLKDRVKAAAGKPSRVEAGVKARIKVRRTGPKAMDAVAFV